MDKRFIVLYYIVLLGSNLLAYYFQIDMSALWLAGVIIMTYLYLLPDIFKKKAAKKKMSLNNYLIYTLPFLLNCLFVLIFY